MSKYFNIQSIGLSTLYKNNKTDAMGMITPDNVVVDMINLLPDTVWNRYTKFLDIACKSGNFLREIYLRLMECEDLKEYKPNKEDRSEYIRKNQIYGICLNTSDKYISARNVFGYLPEQYNIEYINNWVEAVKHIDKKFVMNKIQEAFGENMKFNVIVGNPPYNNDIYLDFVTKSKALGADQICMITPAKWQAKGGDKNEQFRKDIVPYMSDIVFYPDAFELFNIREQEGITYFKIDKELHSVKTTEVICKQVEKFRTKTEHRDNIHITLFGTKIANIINKCTGPYLSDIVGVKQSEFVKNTDSGEQDGEIEVYAGEKLVGYKRKEKLITQEALDKWKITTSVMPVDVGFDKNGQVFGLSKVYTLKPNQVPKGSFPVIMKFNSELECKSFTSYCETKLVRFLYYIGICGKTIAEEFWRFVPDQKLWNHIFTDAELYKKYNLTQEEIAIIESVIKERK